MLTSRLQAVDAVQEYFQKKPDADAYVAILDVSGNAKILQNVVQQGKKLGKAVYVISPDPSNGKVAHINYVSEASKVKK